jgi:hypothetical protein
MTFQLLCAFAAAFWLISLVACALSFRWSFLSVPNRFIIAVILSIGAAVIGYLGLTYFHFDASKTVDGHLVWRVNSRWFFIASIILGVLTLIYAFWKRRSHRDA